MRDSVSDRGTERFYGLPYSARCWAKIEDLFQKTIWAATRAMALLALGLVPTLPARTSASAGQNEVELERNDDAELRCSDRDDDA